MAQCAKRNYLRVGGTCTSRKFITEKAESQSAMNVVSNGLRAVARKEVQVVSNGLHTVARRQEGQGSRLARLHLVTRRSLSSTSTSAQDVSAILRQVEEGQLSASAAESLLSSTISNAPSTPTDLDALESFANLDHKRTKRTGFPEAVFSEGKTAKQIRDILDDMAKHVNTAVECGRDASVAEKAILATRVDATLYKEICARPLKNGTITYHETANLISMKASALDNNSQHDNSPDATKQRERNTVVVACAGTTDLPVAEEAAITLEAAGCKVERIYDVGVAGLHRIINALPRLRDPNNRCVIVCAGMDGALPSVVAGLVTVPVVAVPTSVGYGAAFGGVSAMLTMLNSCAPGVGIVNIDNGFGAAALAFKFVNN